MSDLKIRPDAQGDFLAAAVCGATQPDRPDLPCVLAPHLDGQHEDEQGEEWETVPLARKGVTGRG